MDLDQNLEIFFKPEVRNRATELIEKNVVSMSTASDTRVEAFIRVSAAARVTLAAESISSSTFTAVCNCSAYAKGQFCKHIWATLIKVASSAPDFLENKSGIERAEAPARTQPKIQHSRTPPRVSADRQKMMDERKEAARIRSSEYRKEQYRIQKERKRGAGKPEKQFATSRQELPDDVTHAIAYFENNGFALAQPIDVDALKNAKRLLSRIFHPDKGGSHDEILALNENFDTLFKLSQNE